MRRPRTEETSIFPQAKKAQVDLAALGACMKQRKEELEDDEGPVESGPTNGSGEGGNGKEPPSRE